jgi:hypothetical protein
VRRTYSIKLFIIVEENSRYTILFMEHDLEKAQNLKLILSAFEQLSGLKINFHKSELFCFGEA